MTRIDRALHKAHKLMGGRTPLLLGFVTPEAGRFRLSCTIHREGIGTSGSFQNEYSSAQEAQEACSEAAGKYPGADCVIITMDYGEDV